MRALEEVLRNLRTFQAEFLILKYLGRVVRKGPDLARYNFEFPKSLCSDPVSQATSESIEINCRLLSPCSFKPDFVAHGLFNGCSKRCNSLDIWTKVESLFNEDTTDLGAKKTLANV